MCTVTLVYRPAECLLLEENTVITMNSVIPGSFLSVVQSVVTLNSVCINTLPLCAVDALTNDCRLLVLDGYCL
jgi:hypothetical protein